MIKLIDLLKEAEDKPLSPAEAGALGFVLGKPGEKEFLKKGFALVPTETDLATRAVTSKVVRLPMFDKFRSQINNIRREIKPYESTNDKQIANLAKQIHIGLGTINNLILQIEQNIKLTKQENPE